MRFGRTVFGATLAAGGALLFTCEWLDAAIDATAALHAIWVAAVVLGLIGARLRFEVSLATSLVLPWIGLSLVLPLTIHYAVGSAFGCSTQAFNAWVWTVARWAVPGHVVLALLSGIRCYELAAGRAPDRNSILSIPGLLTTASGVLVVPWLFPCWLAMATALPIAPLLVATDWIAKRERMRLVLPEARVIA